MSDRTRVRLLRLLVVASAVISFVAAGIYAAIEGIDPAAVTVPFLALFFGVLVWLVAPAQPRNALLWIIAGATLSVAIFLAGQSAIAAYWPEVDLPIYDDQIPAELPAAAALIHGVTESLSSVAVFLIFTFGLLLFPDGRLPSRKWRWLGVLCGLGLTGFAVWSVYGWWPSNTSAFDYSSPAGIAIGLFAVLAPLLCLVSLVFRFRKSDTQTRSQIKWIVWGGTMFVPLFVFAVIGAGDIPYAELAFGVAFAMFAGTYGVAIAKYRLYDVDVVLSRTFVYGSLAIFIGAVYVGIVVGLGALFGSGDEPNVWLGIGATVVIAILFQPLRRKLERLANRMVFGRRSTPYEVLSSFSQNVAAVDPDVLEQVARSLTEGTTATAASILVARGDDLSPIASWPIDFPSDGDIEEEVTHEGETMGVIRLSVPTGQVFTPSDAKLLEQVSSGLGLALKNLQLTDDLRARVDDLRESRRRIVSVQDETRQKLERDLHDGAQQRLVALKIKIGIGESMAQAADLDDVADVLATVKGEADMTIDSLRTLARGIYPPLLEAEGLGPALTTQLHRQPIPVTVQAAGVGRYPREIESTVYFCVLEAVQNSIRHAEAQSVLVTVADAEGHLTFEVRDDGVGFDVTETAKGPGLTNITDRVDAAEGSVEIESSPGRGTVVRARLPHKTLETT